MKITGHSNIYKLTLQEKAIMKRRSMTYPNCYYCTIEIKLGEETYSKMGSGGNTRHYYHKACAEEVHLL
jgi:hypothetical protein